MEVTIQYMEVTIHVMEVTIHVIKSNITLYIKMRRWLIITPYRWMGCKAEGPGGSGFERHLHIPEATIAVNTEGLFKYNNCITFHSAL